MSNMEGKRMDPKFAETMARIKAEHPAPVVDVAGGEKIETPVDQTQTPQWKPDLAGAMRNAKFLESRQTDK